MCGPAQEVPVLTPQDTSDHLPPCLLRTDFNIVSGSLRQPRTPVPGKPSPNKVVVVSGSQRTTTLLGDTCKTDHS